MQIIIIALLATSFFTLTLKASESRNGDPKAYFQALIEDKREMKISAEIFNSVYVEMSAFTKLLETKHNAKKTKNSRGEHKR